MPYITVILICCVMTLACASSAGRFLSATRREDYGSAFWLKGAAALCFVAVGLLAAARCRDAAFAWKVAAGLLLGLVGDQLLALRFLKPGQFDLCFASGAASFALGHGLYIWALLSRAPGALTPALVLTAALFAASVFCLKRMEFDAGALSLPAYAYIAVVVFMGSVAMVSAAMAPALSSAMFALGGLCFIVSDNVLCIYSFGRDKRFGLNILVHATYYAAQLLIGWSLFFMV